jgi:hypothetical protein
MLRLFIKPLLSLLCFYIIIFTNHPSQQGITVLYLLHQLGAHVAQFQKQSGHNTLEISYSDEQANYIGDLIESVECFNTTLTSSAQKYGRIFLKHMQQTAKHKSNSTQPTSSYTITIAFDHIIEKLSPRVKKTLLNNIQTHAQTGELT